MPIGFAIPRPRSCALVATLFVAAGSIPGCFTPHDSAEDLDTSDGSGSSGAATDETTGADASTGASDASASSASGADSTVTAADSTGDAGSDGETSAGSDESSGGGDDARQCDGGQCVPDVPQGWQGPVVVHDGEGAAPPCPGEFPSLVHDELFADLDPGAGLCGCECGDVVGATCGSAVLSQAGNFCINNVFNPEQSSLSPGACVFVNNTSGSYDVFAPTLNVAAASCMPNPTEEFPSPTWGRSVRSCATTPGDACEDGACVPQAPAGFESTCVWVDGDAACPAGPWSEIKLAHGGYEDERDCTVCTCGDPVGTCGGDVSLTTQGCGGAGFLIDSIAAGDCATVEAHSHATYTPEVEADCTPSDSVEQGTVAPTGTVTFCCLA